MTKPDDEAAVIHLPREALAGGMDLLDLLVTAGLAESLTAARHAVRAAAVRINDGLAAGEWMTVGLEQLDQQGALTLAAGGNRAVRIEAY